MEGDSNESAAETPRGVDHGDAPCGAGGHVQRGREAEGSEAAVEEAMETEEAIASEQEAPRRAVPVGLEEITVTAERTEANVQKVGQAIQAFSGADLGQAIHRVLTSGARTIEVRQDVHDRYADELLEQISSLVWAHPTIQHSHYKNPNGKVYTLSPWPMDEYWEMTRKVDPNDYLIE